MLSIPRPGSESRGHENIGLGGEDVHGYSRISRASVGSGGGYVVTDRIDFRGIDADWIGDVGIAEVRGGGPGEGISYIVGGSVELQWLTDDHVRIIPRMHDDGRIHLDEEGIHQGIGATRIHHGQDIQGGAIGGRHRSQVVRCRGYAARSRTRQGSRGIPGKTGAYGNIGIEVRLASA